MCDDSFLPHRSAYPIVGPTLRLREQMARFSAPETHAARRAQVDEVIGRLDADDAAAIAEALATDDLARGGDVESVASVVPTVTLSRLLGIARDDAALVADVESVVEVIGRGAAPSAASDAATERVLDLAVDPESAVAVASLLYQNFDATAAAIRAADRARHTGTEPETAVARTRRVAMHTGVVGDARVGAGDEVVLEIGSAGLPFGVGPHECPGRQLAEAIVRGVATAVARAAATRDLRASDT